LKRDAIGAEQFEMDLERPMEMTAVGNVFVVVFRLHLNLANCGNR
jgi:hypothetical protein